MYGRQSRVLGLWVCAVFLGSALWLNAAHAFGVRFDGTITSADAGLDANFRSAAIGSEFTLFVNIVDRSFLSEAPVILFQMGGYEISEVFSGSGFVAIGEAAGNFSAQLSLPTAGEFVASNIVGENPFRPDRIFVTLLREGFTPGETDSLSPASFGGSILDGSIELRFQHVLGGGIGLQSVYGTLDTVQAVPVPAAIWFVIPALAVLRRYVKG